VESGYSDITIFPGDVPVEKGEPEIAVGAPVDGSYVNPATPFEVELPV
jgi:hypothetical protein